MDLEEDVSYCSIVLWTDLSRFLIDFTSISHESWAHQAQKLFSGAWHPAATFEKQILAGLLAHASCRRHPALGGTEVSGMAKSRNVCRGQTRSSWSPKCGHRGVATVAKFVRDASRVTGTRSATQSWGKEHTNELPEGTIVTIFVLPELGFHPVSWVTKLATGTRLPQT